MRGKWVQLIIEALLTMGILSMWAGLLHYHILHKDYVIPDGLPRDNRAVKALLRMQPDLDDLSFYMLVIGTSLAGATGFFSLLLVDTKQKQNYIGVFAAFALTVSAWHLFRLESEETIQKSLKGNVGVDYWSPIISHIVLTLMSMLLMHHNLFKLALFEAMPLAPEASFKICVVLGIFFAQIYFTILVMANFVAGLVLLSAAPFLVIFGYVGGQIWHLMQARKNIAQSDSMENQDDEKTPLFDHDDNASQ
jgi:hypothetical protein